MMIFNKGYIFPRANSGYEYEILQSMRSGFNGGQVWEPYISVNESLCLITSVT